ncbi:COX15/CtaA family protein [Paenibacillus senegalensis]|uniref:COX15/CtaA family protein n=1 Tax=Paenibacillus senegalensis TaxID=1465766 RepID=UPI000288CDF7|nr:COX15/CtaA family protein [Paenibacillus senegalensis]
MYNFWRRLPLNKLSLAAAIGMFIVLLQGAIVTKTGSGEGCGDDWPLCNGKFVPSYTIESMIEYSHRLVSGIEGILILMLFIAVMVQVKRKDVRWYITLALLFTIIQAILGAMVVVFHQPPLVKALHFGISLFAFGCSLLTAVVIRHSAKIPETLPSGVVAGRTFKAPSRLLQFGIWLTTVYCLVVVYLGAYIRHTKSWGGCSGWPLCNGQVIPELSGATGVVFLHRTAALIFFIVLLCLYLIVRRQSELPGEFRQWTGWAFVLVILQVLSGALVTFTIASEWIITTGLLHAVLIAGLFSVLLYLCVRAYQLGER